MSLDVTRVLLDRLAKCMLGFLKLAILLKQRPEIVVDLRVNRALGEGFLIGVERTIDIAGEAKGVAEIVQGLSHVRAKLERLTIARHCVLELLALVLDDAEVVESLSIVRLELNSFLDRQGSFVETAGLAKDLAKIGVVARRFRVDFNRAFQLGDRIVLPVKCRQRHAEDIVRIRVPGPGRDDLSADPLRLCVLSPRIKLAGHFDRLGRSDVDPAMLRFCDRLVDRTWAPLLGRLRVRSAALLLAGRFAPAGGAAFFGAAFGALLVLLSVMAVLLPASSGK